MRRLVRALCAISLTVTALGASTAPAGAHATGGVESTNYRTTITAVEPEVDGVAFRVVNVGEGISMTNTSGTDVTVLGYDGEPYLRVGPDGVFRNTRSPATYRNATTRDDQHIPDTADPNAEPEWERIGDCCTTMWHDHRAHYMGSSAPPAVKAQPDVGRVIIPAWEITVEVSDGPAIVVAGDVEWVPSPSPWPWIALIVGLAAVVIALGFTRRWGIVIGAALAALLACEVVHVIGNWVGVEVSLGEKFGSAIFAVLALVLGVAALAHLLWRGATEAAPGVLVAAVAIGITGGLADIEVFGNSQLPFAFSPDVARLLVATTIGLSIGVVITAGRHLRRAVPPDAPVTADTAPASV